MNKFEELVENLREESGALSQERWKEICITACSKVFEATKNACANNAYIEGGCEWGHGGCEVDKDSILNIKIEDLKL